MYAFVIQSNCLLYLTLGILYYISPMYGLFFHFIVVKFLFLFICLCILYIYLLQNFGVLYTILSLVVIHIGKLVMYSSCI